MMTLRSLRMMSSHWSSKCYTACLLPRRLLSTENSKTSCCLKENRSHSSCTSMTCWRKCSRRKSNWRKMTMNASLSVRICLGRFMSDRRWLAVSYPSCNELIWVFCIRPWNNSKMNAITIYRLLRSRNKRLSMKSNRSRKSLSRKLMAGLMYLNIRKLTHRYLEINCRDKIFCSLSKWRLISQKCFLKSWVRR